MVVALSLVLTPPSQAQSNPPSSTPTLGPTSVPETDPPSGEQSRSEPDPDPYDPEYSQSGCHGLSCIFEISSGEDDSSEAPDDCINHSEINEVYFGYCDDNTPIVAGFIFHTTTIASYTQIESAHLRFTVDGTYDNALELEVFAEATSSPDSFDVSPPSDRIGSLVIPKAEWDVDTEWESGDHSITVDVTDVISTVLTTTSWLPNSDISFIVKTVGGTGHRRVMGYERFAEEGIHRPTRLIIQLKPYSTLNVGGVEFQYLEIPLTDRRLGFDGLTPDDKKPDAGTRPGGTPVPTGYANGYWAGDNLVHKDLLINMYNDFPIPSYREKIGAINTDYFNGLGAPGGNMPQITRGILGMTNGQLCV